MTNLKVLNVLNDFYNNHKDNDEYWNAGINDDDENGEKFSLSNWGLTGSKHSHSSCKCNKFGGASQCYGYSLLIAYLIFGHKLTCSEIENASDGETLTGGWTIYKENLESLSLEPGDIIRDGESASVGHSAVVRSVSNSEIKVTECWGSNAYGCKLAWGNFNGSSSNKNAYTLLQKARWILKAPHKSTYTIKNRGSGKYLTPLNSSVTNGTRVVQLSVSNADNQKWEVSTKNNIWCIMPKSDTKFAIKYATDNYRCFIHNRADCSLETEIVHAENDTIYKVKTQKNGVTYYLAADAVGSNVYWTSEDSTAYQQWVFTETT